MGKSNTWLNDIMSQSQKLRTDMVISQEYYDSENTAIMNRTKKVYLEDGSTSVDPYSSNYKMPSGYHYILTEQKVNYSLNDKMVALAGTTDFADIMGRKWGEVVQTAGRQATVKGYSVLQFYMEDGAVKYKEIPSEQIIFCRDGDLNVVEVVRAYEKRSEDDKTVNVIEVWDSQTVSVYQQNTGGTWDCIRQDPHLVTQTAYGSSVQEEVPTGWGRPPFAVFYNNKRLKNDLLRVKAWIDAFDFASSDFANNLDDFQEAFWILKNYDGQDLKEFRDMVGALGAVKVGHDGEATMQTQEIPHEAKTVFLDMCEQKIYKFGMGVNTSNIEGNVTNVRIYAMYSDLDLKANTFEINATSFLEDCAFFYGYDPESVEVTFDRSVIVNNIENAELANASKGFLSEKTRLSNDPRVNDVEEEIKLMTEDSTRLSVNMSLPANVVEETENVEE